ncbi:MAG: peptidase S10 [Planctomycetota bacterium]
MMSLHRLFLCAALITFGVASLGAAAEETAADADAKALNSEQPKRSITEGVVTIAGEEVVYAATAGKVIQRGDDDDEKAEVFFVAYTRGGLHEKTGTPDYDPSRPITFCFNGGPGSSSVWLHLGMMGPQRVRLPDDASHPAPPFTTVENPFSLLDVTDIVMIDPVSTGFSRPAEDEKKGQFHGIEEDVKSVGRFIHDYVSEFGRWGSPKFVLGESYGGIRSAGLARELQDRYRMYLNGVVLVSAVLDFSTLRFNQNNDLPFVLFLPAYTATAWRHKALSDDLLAKSLEDVVAEAEAFALGPYADALLRGYAMEKGARRKVTKEMSRLTGLSVDYLEGANLRVEMWEFSKELLRDRGQIIGRFDSRYVGASPEKNGESMEYDASGAAFSGIFAGALNGYLREVLAYDEPRVYEISGSVRPWNYKPYENRYATVADRLAMAMTKNPHLQVFAACGYYDLATPAFAMEYTRDHALLSDDLQKRFHMGYYEGGHMMYVHEPSLKKLRKDLLEFYKAATP